jgi:hypothetical protein
MCSRTTHLTTQGAKHSEVSPKGARGDLYVRRQTVQLVYSGKALCGGEREALCTDSLCTRTYRGVPQDFPRGLQGTIEAVWTSSRKAHIWHARTRVNIKKCTDDNARTCGLDRGKQRATRYIRNST